MTRLIHLTDLHFGLHHDDLVEPLRKAILANKPDVIVVSGDLTQRARAGQFRQAMAFVKGLGLEYMVIPGNHDLPFYNLFLRVLNPFAPYRKSASGNLTPRLQVGQLCLYGINTADPFRWRGGVARKAEIAKVCQAMRDGPAGATNILVCHHPLQEPQGFQRNETRHSDLAMDMLVEAGLDVVLSGHLHHWTTGLGLDGGAAKPIFQMQTGTALCARQGERDHGFAVMDFVGDRLMVTPWIVDVAAGQFQPDRAASFARTGGLWHAVRPH